MDTAVEVTTVGLLGVNEVTAVTVIGAVAIIVSTPTLICNTPAVTLACVAVPAYVTFGILTEVVVKLASVPAVILTQEAVTAVTVNDGKVFAVKLVTSVT